jgi:hypothetical protein
LVLALSFGNCSKIFYARREDKRFDTTKTQLRHWPPELL